MKKSQKKILCLVGPMACGKGAIKEYLKSHYGAQECRFSTSMRDVLARLDIPVERDNLVKLSVAVREAFGQDIFSKVVVSDIKNLDSDIVVLDGARRLEDLKYIKDLPGFTLISVDADSKIRYRRLVERNENKGDAEKTYEQFIADHELDTERSIPSVMKMADFTIDNSGSLEEMKKKVDDIMDKLV